ncbi:FkbM family methyltransferase [Patescibacteria group bacterium]|nr:FkbM family methyltransferase [Candidatus Micrarchaeota archaeon]MBU1758374.1 FkbM family methyltransferase [Patescibacteria group bacterium]
MKNPLISIVIPTKNSAETLGPCLHSIKAQTYRNYELIIVDAFSTDNTPQLARKFTDKFFTSKHGRSGARNFGFSKAKGSIFLSIDSDMILEKNLLIDITMNMNKHGGLILPEIGYGNDFISKCKDLEKRCYITDETIESTRAFSQKAFESVGGYDTNLVFGEDWDIHSRIKSNFTIGRTKSKILHNTVRISLLSNFKKAYLYGKTLPKYIEKSHLQTKKWFDLRNIFFLRHFSKLKKEPTHAVGLFFIKTMEYLCAFLGFCVFKLNGLSPNKIITLFKIMIKIKDWSVYTNCFLNPRISSDIIRLRNGISFKIRKCPSDLWIIVEVWIHQPYIQHGFKITENDTVIDTGAHIGSFSLFAASHAKNGRVLSFEPVKDNYNLMQSNIKLNCFTNIEPINLGVSGKRGPYDLYMPTSDTTCYSIYQKQGNPIQIKCTTLDNIFNDYNIKKCNFLKLDCEGAEYDILSNTSDTVFKKIDKIVLECHDGFFDCNYDTDKLGKFLEKKGFIVTVKQPMMYAIKK